ncbi:MAG: hypothetical protein ACAH59_08545 [Pseudobdellovibrionaceae bacterium]
MRVFKKPSVYLVSSIFLIMIGLNLVFPSSAEAAIAFRSKTFTSFGTSSTSKTVTEPAGAAQNDILFLWMVLDGSPTVTTPTGWTLLHSIQGVKPSKTALFWIRRGASAPSYVVNFTSSGYGEFSVTAWSGAETSGSPIHKNTTNGTRFVAPPEPDPPAVTTTVANTMIVIFGMGWSGWSSIAGAPTGYTIRESGVNGNNNDIAVASKALAAAGTEDPGKFTGGVLNPGNQNDVAEVTIALMEPGAVSAAPVRHRVIQN